MKLSGPMFEPSDNGTWKSLYGKDGAHYNQYRCRDNEGMKALEDFFPDGEADHMNFVLFSTSGIHGSYATIEDVEKARYDMDDEYDLVTFLIVQPRICCLRHGNCIPKTEDDFLFLKKLRDSSFNAISKIGMEVTNE